MEFDLQTLLLIIGQKDYELAVLAKKLAEKEEEIKSLRSASPIHEVQRNA